MGRKRRSIGRPGCSRDGTPGRRQRNRPIVEQQRRLERYARGGLSQRRFCERHDLPLSTLTYWLRQGLRRGTTSAGPVVVELPWELGPEAALGDARGEHSAAEWARGAPGFEHRGALGGTAAEGAARMFGLNEQTRVFLRTGVTDGRLGIDGLRGLVGRSMRQDVLRGALYVF